ncbi:DNA recombination protein RecN [Campylobacter sp. MIT 12-5580]|uniref:DNA recombination protein RecN n=1 Tax=Campylobacter sp. MIT 12-5580 TaxID=2040651 RepID=UPI0010F685FC|nr:DNA recombination protein RecN [Campylobacter sp. MIT 12-5580]TKX28944.1 DNA recombination protein RecN [Campylobacter sp. MIT 12-5580]
MITKVFMRENVGFKLAELELKPGLTVFTGLSGAGKSVLFKGILSAFALSDSEAKFVELELNDRLDLSDFGIFAEEENSFKMLKDKTTKYFINNQSIAKKSLNQLCKSFVKYLSAKENNEFSNENFLFLLDTLEEQKDANFANSKFEFGEVFKRFLQVKNELETLLKEEQKVEELKELAQLQIQKIEQINPKPNEFEELMSLKKRLSKKDKIEQAWNKANEIFTLEKSVLEALSLSEVDSSFFSDCLNELRVIAEKQSFDELEFDIEAVLDRIESLSGLIKRYESIENALLVLEQKKKELARYENLSFEKKELEIQLKELEEQVLSLAQTISTKRKQNLSILENFLNEYLQNLYMKNIHLKLETIELNELGFDLVNLEIDKTGLKNLSSGELNRLRLAFIATQCRILNAGKGIIFLDEIDANLSGKEAMSIAKVLDELSKYYQIFAISHLPQLSSYARNHFLVEKQGTQSIVRRLEKDERVNELARMVSGEKITTQALEFAKTLLENVK